MLQTILGLLLCLIKVPVLGVQSQQCPCHRAVHTSQVPTEQVQRLRVPTFKAVGIAKPPAVSRADLQGTRCIRWGSLQRTVPCRLSPVDLGRLVQVLLGAGLIQ